MPIERRIQFAPFQLDLVNQCLWKGSEVIKLRPKAFAVLEHLLARPGELVTKEDLITAVWQDTFVGDAVLKVAIRQIREALSDDSKAPRFIETAHRRGYRFIGGMGADRPSGMEPPGAVLSSMPDPPGKSSGFVGREAALSRLYGWFEKVRKGERQLVFVTGEAGIGKTTLLDMFARSMAGDPATRICSGQCLEQYGMSEAYLPVLDAIAQLCRKHAHVADVLRAHAPMWLMQMPSLLTPADRDAFGRETAGATRERMLREMGEALDALAARAPLMLVLEDLHWSDFSTLDLISYVARRRTAAHLMVVATYRPAELIARGHPLKTVKRDLLARRQCEELPLEYLTAEAVGEYLGARFQPHRFPAELIAMIHERTEGHPLFMVNTIDHLIAERLIEHRDDGWQMTAPIDMVKLGVPDSIRQLIETQIDRLDARDQRMLETASVVGAEFAPETLAAVTDDGPTQVETRCEELSRRHQFIQECGVQVLPDGRAVGRYGFVHALYRHVFYDRVPASRRIQLHRRIGARGEALYGERRHEIAAELAMHFERAADHRQAARYVQQAAVNAMHRSAYREAIVLSRHGLDLLAALPDSDERTRQELWLQLTLGVPLIATAGYAAAEVGAAYLRARELCERLGTTSEISQVLWGLWTFHTLRAELSTALEIAGEFLHLSTLFAYPGLDMRGHWAMEITCTHQGKFAIALDHFEKALSLYTRDRQRGDGFVDVLNPGVAMRGFAGWSLWLTGHPDRALVPMRDAVALARSESQPHSLAHALASAAVFHQLRQERSLAQQYADEAMTLSEEHGLPLYQAMGAIVQGWALIGRGQDQLAVDTMREGLAAWQTTGAQLMRPYFLALLAEAPQPVVSDEEAIALLDEALRVSEATSERFYCAELHRLKGERLLTHARNRTMLEAAQECFERALAIAREQEARALELRAALSLGRLQSSQGGEEQARQLLMPLLSRFEEGLATPDLLSARALLDQLIT